MIVSIIAAVADNLAIGKDDRLPWHLPADMKFFRDTTIGHHVIMGRKNYESLPSRFRPLPDRTNIVLSRSPMFRAEGCKILPSLEQAIDLAKANGEKEAFIIGGGEVYREAMQKGLADKIYITWVHSQPAADTWFPEIDAKEWKLISRNDHGQDEQHAAAYSFCQYSKIT